MDKFQKSIGARRGAGQLASRGLEHSEQPFAEISVSFVSGSGVRISRENASESWWRRERPSFMRISDDNSPLRPLQPSLPLISSLMGWVRSQKAVLRVNFV